MWRSLYTVHIRYIEMTVCTNWDLFGCPNRRVLTNKVFQIQSTLWACFYCTTIGAVAYSNAYFGRGTGPILLDDLLCTGREARLIDCPRFTSQGIGTYDFCPNGHGEDAGVGCATRKYNQAWHTYILCWTGYKCITPYELHMHTSQLVMMEVSDWLEVLDQMKDVWKFVWTVDGALCVMMLGELWMPVWPADSLDTLHTVSM